MKPVVEAGPIPFVVKTLQEMQQENEVDRSRLDKQDECSRNRLKLTPKLKGCFKPLSRLPPILRNLLLKLCCFLVFMFKSLYFSSLFHFHFE